MAKILKGIALILVGIWLVAMYRTKFGHDTLTKASPDIIIVGVEVDKCPFSFVKNNQLIGFDIDLTQALAERIGKQRVIKKLSSQDAEKSLTEESTHLIPSTNMNDDFLISELYLEQYQPRFFLFNKKSAALNTLINNALAEIQEDGTLSELKKKWSIL
jgi:ABC-type amino acid transport substrate-binding protein